MAAKRVLILGGTAEAVQLAARLNADPDFEPITSLAGRTREPAPVPGLIRTGGFGGKEGLARYLRADTIDAVIDATHPFAEQISSNAAEVCRSIGVPRLRRERPPWQRVAGDNWIDATDVDDAARKLVGHGKRVFLSIGRQELSPFHGLADIWFLLRMIDGPSKPVPLAHHELILGRGPFAVDSEVGLLRDHRIDAVVSKNSGGEATYGKIVAARRLGLPIVMIRRPAAPPGDRAESIAEALDWLGRAGLS